MIEVVFEGRKQAQKEDRIIIKLKKKNHRKLSIAGDKSTLTLSRPRIRAGEILETTKKLIDKFNFSVFGSRKQEMFESETFSGGPRERERANTKYKTPTTLFIGAPKPSTRIYRWSFKIYISQGAYSYTRRRRERNVSLVGGKNRQPGKTNKFAAGGKEI